MSLRVSFHICEYMSVCNMFLPTTAHLSGLCTTTGDTRSLCKILTGKHERWRQLCRTKHIWGYHMKTNAENRIGGCTSIEVVHDVVYESAHVIMALNIWVV